MRRLILYRVEKSMQAPSNSREGRFMKPLRYLRRYDVLHWWAIGNLLYANVRVESDFYYGQNIAKKVFWRFYWLEAT